MLVCVFTLASLIALVRGVAPADRFCCCLASSNGHFAAHSPSLRHQFAWLVTMAWTRLVLCTLLTPAGALSPRLVLPHGKAAAVAGGAYGLYSWMVLRRLAPRYAAMRCLAAIAAPTPNATAIAELAEALPARGPPAPAPADEAWEQLWPAGAPDGPLEAKRSGWRDAGDDAVAVRREGAAWRVFARQGDDAARPPGSVLAELADPTRPVVEGPSRACAGRARCGASTTARPRPRRRAGTPSSSATT